MTEMEQRIELLRKDAIYLIHHFGTECCKRTTKEVGDYLITNNGVDTFVIDKNGSRRVLNLGVDEAVGIALSVVEEYKKRHREL